MEVIIDGERYIKMPESVSDKGLLSALEVRFESDAGDGITVRDYLRSLLAELWIRQEGFSGKRPFGNSGWHYELLTPLVKAGFIDGTINEDCWADFTDEQMEKAHAYVAQLIVAAFNGVSD